MKYGISNLTVIGARFSKSCSEFVEEWWKDEGLSGGTDERREKHTALNTGKPKVRTHQELATPAQLFDLPDER